MGTTVTALEWLSRGEHPTGIEVTLHAAPQGARGVVWIEFLNPSNGRAGMVAVWPSSEMNYGAVDPNGPLDFERYLAKSDDATFFAVVEEVVRLLS